MKKLSLMVLCALMSVAVFAQQKIKSEELGLISAISLSGKLNVEYIPSDKNAIEIDLYNSDIKKFRWSVTDGKLDVMLRPSEGAYANVKIWSKSEDLTSLAMSGCEFKSSAPINTQMLTVDVSYSAKATIPFKCQDLEMSVSSSAVLSGSGETKYFELKATEKSRVDVREMEAISVEVDASTGAEVYLTALERLVAYPKTSATIFYKGNPTITKLHSSKVVGMGASIHKIE